MHCENCEQEIPRKRLEIFPGIKYCVRCQTELEIKNPHVNKPKMEIYQTLSGWQCENIETKIIKPKS